VTSTGVKVAAFAAATLVGAAGVLVTTNDGGPRQAEVRCATDDQTRGRVLVLSPSGTNTNPGTLEAPRYDLTGWTPTPDTTVYLRGGVYKSWRHVNWGGVNGPAATRLTVRNYPGESPVIQGGTGFMVLWGSSANDVTVRGLAFDGMLGSVIVGTASSSHGANISAGAPHHITIECNLFAKVTYDHGVYLGGKGDVTLNGAVDPARKSSNRLHDWVIRDNVFTGIARTSPWATDPNHSQAAIHSYHSNGAYNVTVTGNTFTNNEFGILVSAEGQDGWRVENNAFNDNRVAVGFTNYAENCPFAACLNWTHSSNMTVTGNIIRSEPTQNGIMIEQLWAHNQTLTAAPWPKPLAIVESRNTVTGGCLVRWNGQSGGGGTCFRTFDDWRAARNGAGRLLEPAQGVGSVSDVPGATTTAPATSSTTTVPPTTVEPTTTTTEQPATTTSTVPDTSTTTTSTTTTTTAKPTTPKPTTSIFYLRCVRTATKTTCTS